MAKNKETKKIEQLTAKPKSDNKTTPQPVRNAFTALLQASKKPLSQPEPVVDSQNAEKSKKRKAQKRCSSRASSNDDEDNEDKHSDSEPPQASPTTKPVAQKNSLAKFLVPVDKFAQNTANSSQNMKIQAIVHGSPGKKPPQTSANHKKRPRLRKSLKGALNDKLTDSIELVSSEIVEIEPNSPQEIPVSTPNEVKSSDEELIPVAKGKKTKQSRLSFGPQKNYATEVSVTSFQESKTSIEVLEPPKRKSKPTFSLRIRLRDENDVPSNEEDPDTPEAEVHVMDFEESDKVSANIEGVLDTAFTLDDDEPEPVPEESDSRRRSSRIASRKVALPSSSSSSDEEIAVLDKKKGKKRMKKNRQSGSDDEIVEIEADGKTKKMAAIFARPSKAELAKRKVLENQQNEAKRKFLMSGLPEIVKIQQEIIHNLENQEVPLFPTISHVMQHSPDLARLSYPESLLQRLKPSQDPSAISNPPSFTLRSTSIESVNVSKPSASVQLPSRALNQVSFRTCQSYLTELSLKYPSVPIHSVFATVLDKRHTPDELWTEKYRPRLVSEVLGQPALKRLEAWLKNWVNSTTTEKKSRYRKRRRSNSDSDFDDFDGTRTPSPVLDEDCNTFLISGPSGVGKSVSVYALAESLGFTVLEVNASSRRNHKNILAKLQEATQSHRLQRDGQAIDVSQPEKDNLTMLLFEDVDITFEEEDEGFWNALSTFMASSKRPIILTTTSKSDHLKSACFSKIKGDFNRAHFDPPGANLSACFLWSVCFAEGVAVRHEELLTLCNSWECDLRKCLLHLQYYTRPLRTFECKFSYAVQTAVPTDKKPKVFKLADRKDSKNLKQSKSEPVELVIKVKQDCDSTWKPELVSLDLTRKPSLSNVSSSLASVCGLEAWVKPAFITPVVSQPRTYGRTVTEAQPDPPACAEAAGPASPGPASRAEKPRMTQQSKEELRQFECLLTTISDLSELSLLEFSDAPYWRESVDSTLAKDLSDAMINFDLSQRFQSDKLLSLTNSVEPNLIDEELFDFVSPCMLLTNNACHVDVLPTLRTICKLEEHRKIETMKHSRRAQRFTHYLSCNAKMSMSASQTLYF